MKGILISICFLWAFVPIASAQITSISLDTLIAVGTNKYSSVQTAL